MATKKDFTAHNTINLCGKVVKKTHPKKDEVRFQVSCGHRGAKKDANGRIHRDVITVRFFDGLAKKYDEMFGVGDFVTVNAVAQNVRNHYTGTAKVDIWGIAMGPKLVNGKMIQDHNHVNIRGKISSSAVINNSLLILNVETKVEKKYQNPRKETEYPILTDTFNGLNYVHYPCYGKSVSYLKD